MMSCIMCVTFSLWYIIVICIDCHCAVLRIYTYDL